MSDVELDLSQAYSSAIVSARMRQVLSAFNAQDKAYLAKISSLTKSVDELLLTTPNVVEANIWRLVSISLHAIRTDIVCRAMAMDNEGNLLNERERFSVLVTELRSQLDRFCSDHKREHQIILQMLNEDVETIDAERLVEFLEALPIPTTYQKKRGESLRPSQDPSENETPDSSITRLIRVIAFIDNAPLVSPQLLKPQLIYSLKFILKGTMWPDDASSLILDLATTYPEANYSVSDFVVKKPTEIVDEYFEAEANGHIQFNTAQTLLSENIFFTVRCAYDKGELGFSEVPAIGYNQLDFRIVDPGTSGIFSKYRHLDGHIYQLIQDLIDAHPSVQNELSELLPLLTAMTNLLGTYAQGAVFGDTSKLSESAFQKQALRDLRFTLGQDVEEHTSQAGGYTDLRYRSVVIELKVETENGDREYIRDKYTSQATQYEGVEGRQVSVLLVLDLTPKILPPGDIRNDILLADVPTHGGSDESKRYPSKTFIFVVNGNLQKPSSYSRQ